MEAGAMSVSNSHTMGGDNLAQSRVPGDPRALVIFGATGDLSFRKLAPALFNLHRRKRLPHPFLVIGCGRSPMTSEDFRERVLAKLSDSGRGNLSHWSEFAASLFLSPTGLRFHRIIPRASRCASCSGQRTRHYGQSHILSGGSSCCI